MSDNQNENKTIERKHIWKYIPCFVKFCEAFGMIPTTFRMAMTYEEQVLWICKFLQETIIPALQNDSQAIEEIQNVINNIEQNVQEIVQQMADDGDLNEAINSVIEPQLQEIYDLIGNLNLPEGESISEGLENTPQKIINPEYFYRFKNMIDNSSFEVFNGNTLQPYGWDNGIVTEDASMFNSHSLQINAGQIVKQTGNAYIDIDWIKGAYETDEAILCFYHKWDAVGVKIYDLVNESYLTLTKVNSDLSDGESGTEIVFQYDENWNMYRKMIKFTPSQTTRKIRIEFNCKTGGQKGKCFIDAPMLEPFLEGEFPSIYKDGRYSTSAYQILNPPPFDVDRFTPLEHLNISVSTADSNGQIYYQEMTRTDGTLAIKREASNPDTNGFYQTFVETFYKGDGQAVNYVDTYSYTYTDTGAILTKSKTTTEVMF